MRLVDDERGPWGHLNFDEFLFHQTRPVFVDERDPAEKFEIGLPPVDFVPYAGLSAEEAANAMTAPDGFSITVAAVEPDVVRPIDQWSTFQPLLPHVAGSGDGGESDWPSPVPEWTI